MPSTWGSGRLLDSGPWNADGRAMLNYPDLHKIIIIIITTTTTTELRE
jgi:hypothetical protein